MKKKWIPIVAAVVFLLAGCAAGVLLYSDTLFGPEPLPAVVSKESAAEVVDYGYTVTPTITTAVKCGNTDAAYTILKNAQAQLKANTLTVSDMSDVLADAISQTGALSQYYYYLDQLSIELDGTKYGAYVEEGQDPIGGGAGYSEIFTTGDYIVSTAEELYQAMRKAEPGEVIYIEGGTVIDLGYHLYDKKLALNIREGVTIASNRGYVNPDGTVETGAIIRNPTTAGTVFFMRDNSRLTGIVLEGPTKENHEPHHTRAYYTTGIGADYFYGNMLANTAGLRVAGSNVEIDNCELSGFGYGAIIMEGDIYTNVKDLWVHHCYVHHNQMKGLGYGIMNNDYSESIVEYCLFNYNRHSIAGTGRGDTGYIARYNVEMGESLSHCFDMHGIGRRDDPATDIAGEYCEMYNNTFLAEDYPYWLRGVPNDYQTFHHNNCLYPYETYDPYRLIADKVSVYDNIFGIDEQTLVP